MTGSFGPEAAEARAEHWLRENGFTTLPTDVHAIAKRLGIHVEAKDEADAGVSGMLLRHGDEFAILYATHIRSAGFQRFSIAHELGHYLLEGHAERLFPEGRGKHVSHAGFTSSDNLEREADHFASGLLMPDGPFRALLRRCSEGLVGIEELANKCETSLTATAIRYAKKTSVPAAIVVSTDGRIDYAFLSGEMREFPGVRAPVKGDYLPVGSRSVTFAASREKVAARARDEDDVDLNLWFGGRSGRTAKEEVIGLGSYGRVLTVITTDFLAEDGDEDGEMEANWTPRHHRR